ncbi:MAG: MBL fold metallo-hydrolase [Deltaproteobacteria bacterium]|nr:MBL fold metallo-hydrolase [Deltaproteobacteria bacterium]
MIFRQLFEPDTSTYTYLLADEATGEAVLIDPVREKVDRDLGLLKALGLTLKWTLDTHAHADHITGAGLLRARTGCQVAISKDAGVENADKYLGHGDKVPFGRHHVEARATPGHTSGCMSFISDDRAMAFTGDALLIRKCGRTDFQQGDPARLYRSIHEQIFALPDTTAVYPGHDYNGMTMSTVGEEKKHNERLGGGRSEGDFVKLMKELKLPYPRYIDQALPANRHAGLLAEDKTAM